MSTSLDNIWDDEITPSNAFPCPSGVTNPFDSDDEGPSTAPKRRSTKLFLSDSEDDVQIKERPKSIARELSPEIEALFNDLDDVDDDGFQELAPPLDVAALTKEADARAARAPRSTPKEIVTISTPVDDRENTTSKPREKEKGEPKERKAIARLNETVLLGTDGFPALVKQVKNFKPKGKGHEVTDLNRLLQVYNFWSHNLYPKGQFKDNVQRIEKLCHSKRMHVALSVWNDESKGLVNGRRIDDPIDLTSGSEDDEEDKEQEKRDSNQSVPEGTRSSPPTMPPSSASEYNSMAEDDDVDMDALIREDEERLAPANSTQRTATGGSAGRQDDTISGVPDVTDEDEAMWAQLGADLDEFTNLPTHSTTTGEPSLPRAPVVDDDEEMWDVVREMEMEEAAKGTGGSHTNTRGSIPPAGKVVDASRATNDEGWDEMYAELDPK